MKNEEIIARIAVANGIYTIEEIENMIAQGQEIPLHTFKGWKDRGMTVRKGEHGVTCKLWKKKNKKQAEEDKGDEENGFYLTKSYLFSREQVEEEKRNGNFDKNDTNNNVRTVGV